MTAIDIWVKKLNKLCNELQEIEENIHPSAWEEETKELRNKFRRIANGK